MEIRKNRGDGMQKLINIQKDLKAPKGNYNSFGKYKYRSCEDILEAVKPLLAREECTLKLSDEVVMVGDRYYIKATATIGDGIGTVSVTAYARESDEKKGMDSSQVTGTASSYARKYALNGLFLIDDTKDADTDEYHAQNAPKKVELATSAQKKMLIDLCKERDVDVNEILKEVGCTDKMTAEQHGKALQILKDK